MLRVIRSTIESIHIDGALEDDFDDAVTAALRDPIRETYKTDEIGQKTSHIALMPYTDPTGARRWAVWEETSDIVHCQDTDDLNEAITAYETTVRMTSKSAGIVCDDEGNEQPLWDETDVTGVAARTVNDGASNSSSAYLIDATWAHEDFLATEAEYQQATRRRQVAFAQMIASRRRGAQAILARHVSLKEPTVKTIVTKGRQILADRAAAARDAG
ncbi:hypothetical protein ACIQVO_38370 [Streptomyces sp. NPDC101062]|uniref:hypothetical protein n=1 Tax=unclassified Streptomyces TaxID=2593676 RepID=UPI00381528A4